MAAVAVHLVVGTNLPVGKVAHDVHGFGGFEHRGVVSGLAAGSKGAEGNAGVVGGIVVDTQFDTFGQGSLLGGSHHRHGNLLRHGVGIRQRFDTKLFIAPHAECIVGGKFGSGGGGSNHFVVDEEAQFGSLAGNRHELHLRANLHAAGSGGSDELYSQSGFCQIDEDVTTIGSLALECTIGSVVEDETEAGDVGGFIDAIVGIESVGHLKSPVVVCVAGHTIFLIAVTPRAGFLPVGASVADAGMGITLGSFLHSAVAFVGVEDDGKRPCIAFLEDIRDGSNLRQEVCREQHGGHQKE